MDVYTTTVKFFQEGGLFMYPIAIVLALGGSDRRSSAGSTSR